MNALVPLGLIFRLLWRDWKSDQLRLLVSALVVMVAIITSIALFMDRLERALIGESSVFLAADRIVSGTAEVPKAWTQKAQAEQLKITSTMSFPSMASTELQHQLVAVKAVAEDYPLRGHLVVAETPFGQGVVTTDVPKPGEVWLDSRLFPVLQVEPGDDIELGVSSFEITKVLISEPDRGGDVFGLGPRLLMHISDVPATQLIQPGSRVNHRTLFSGREQDLDRFYEWIKPRLRKTAFAWLNIQNSSPSVSAALDRATNFLLLGGLLGVVLAGVAVALVAHRYSTRHFDHVAVLKTLGVTPRGIVFLFLAGLVALGLVAILAGLIVGFVVQHGASLVFAQFISISLPAPGFRPVLTGMLTGLIALLTFAFPPIVALRNVEPIRVLRRDFTNPTSARAFYAVGCAGVLALLFWYSGSIQLTGIVLLGLIVVLALLLSLAYLLFLLGSTLGTQARSAWRLALSGIRRRRRDSSVQVLIFAVVIMVLLLLTLVRTDLLQEWRAQLPKDAANHFVINITQEQREPLQDMILANTESNNSFFPSLRGRMTHIGGEPVQDREKRYEGEFEDGPRAASERNLTWSETLPKDNQLIAGQWWSAEQSRPLVSLESYIADILQAKLGEVIRFQVADQVIEAEVANIRKVRWDGFRPNFYIIFSPGVLDEFPGTWITSFYLPPERKLFLNTLLSRFPTVTVIEIDALMVQVQALIERIILAVELVFVLIFVAGVFALIASVGASLDVRGREYAILFALGANRRTLLTGLLVEFGALGLCAGIMGAVGAELAALFLWREVFILDPVWHSALWWFGPATGLLAIGVLGLATTWRVLYTPPIVALRNL